MKRIHNIYFTLLAALLLVTASSCYKDKGNYDYHDINKVSLALDTVKAGATINVNQGDTLRFTPQIIQTMDKDESKFTYEWMIFDNTATSDYNLPQTVVSTSRNLGVIIAEPNFTLGKRYRLQYKVTDTVTRVINFFAINVNVVNRYGTGWMVLEDLPNGGDYSMILPGDVVEHKVFAQFNPGIPMGTGSPLRLDISPYTVSDAITTGYDGKRIYVIHPNNGIEIHYQNMKKMYDINNLFFNPPAILKPQTVTWFNQSGYAGATIGMTVSDGKVYIAELGGYPGAKKFGGALLTATNTDDYTATPWIASGLTYPIIYDSRNKRFHIVRPTKLDNFPDTVSTVANLNNLGMELVHMDESNVARAHNVILKDNAGVRQLLRITFSASTYVLTSFLQTMNAPDINNATAFASTTGSPHIFYSVGNLLYKYETTSNTTVPAFTFPASESIVKIVCRAGTEMLVATWNGTTGKVYKFSITATGAITGNTFTNEYTGFGKVIDMRYKS